jgi:predicted nucleic acid-binding protein
MPPSPIVSDTSPLLYLGRIGQLDLLPKLFSQVHVPEQVARELDTGRLLHRDTLDPRQFPWIAIVPVSAIQIEALPLNALGLGERAAIAYAVHNPNTEVALDDRQARLLASKFNLPVIGLVGILLKAKTVGILSAVKLHLDAARSSGFFLHSATYARALSLAGEAV